MGQQYLRRALLEKKRLQHLGLVRLFVCGVYIKSSLSALRIRRASGGIGECGWGKWVFPGQELDNYTPI